MSSSVWVFVSIRVIVCRCVLVSVCFRKSVRVCVSVLRGTCT